jgi:predicted RNase H-like HicB family nuclease
LDDLRRFVEIANKAGEPEALSWYDEVEGRMKKTVDKIASRLDRFGPVDFSSSPTGTLAKMRMAFRIVVTEDEDGYYVAQCLEVPGAISQGSTKEEALRNVKEALALMLEVLGEEAKSGEVVRVEMDV